MVCWILLLILLLVQLHLLVTCTCTFYLNNNNNQLVNLLTEMTSAQWHRGAEAVIYLLTLLPHDIMDPLF